MWSKILFLSAVWVGFANYISGGEAQEAKTTPQELVRGVLARSEAIFSGKIDYRQERGFADSKKELPHGEYRVIFSGSSWRLYSKYVASEIPVSHPKGQNLQADEPNRNGFLEITDLSHRGKSVNYNITPQSDDTFRNTAKITRGKLISSLSNTFNGPPVFAGSFWFNCMKEFIQKHQDKVVRKPDAEVNGVKTHVLEWEVSDAEKFEAFHASRRGGFLRLYVAPELGFALPRIEHAGPDGLIDAAYDSVGFKEHAPGIFIPRNCRLQYYINRVASFYVKYEITNISQLNEPIADSEFVVQLPVGTVVADSRNGKSSTIFKIEERGKVPGDLEDIITIQPKSFWDRIRNRNWRNALLAGIGGGLLLLVVIYVFSRRFLLRRMRT